ncbi:hypothetical protein C8J56DRAFT_1006570 [Mycena floridula]|nr:hypothetical protein C8J56DRAFT_1006570 [Mycena floridula]
MDNAGNCNTTVTELIGPIPQFKGMLWRGRCFLHILQLVARMIISFFFKQYKRKKRVKVSGAQGAIEELTITTDGESPADAEEIELAQLLEEEAAESEAHSQAQSANAAAKEAHDGHVVKLIRDIAIVEMRRLGVTVTEAETKSALQIFPKVCGLAKKVHDSTTVGAAFQTIVDNSLTVIGETRALARRCASRWNSEYDCLNSNIKLKEPVKALLANKDLNLKSFKLTEGQWVLSKDLCDLLDCLKEPTLLFSKGKTALICDVIPAFDELIDLLDNASELESYPNVCRVAAHAGKLVAQKYFDIIGGCEAYEIAIVMCPSRKLQWFRDHGRSEVQIRRIRDRVISRFNETYKAPSSMSASTSSAPNPAMMVGGRDRFRKPNSASSTPFAPKLDDMEYYLDTGPFEHRGLTVLQYWNAELDKQPALAKMGLAYCSAPGSWYP